MSLQEFSSELADAVEHSGAGIVTIYARRRQSASGIVWQADLVLTADHVIQRDEHIKVVGPDGTEYQAHVVGRDPSSDVALLRVPNANFTPAALAKTEPRVGQLALAVGRPSSVQASFGIINAIGGPVPTRRGTLAQYLRTDATPYPGFSGGGLVNVQGEIVGLFTSGFAGGEPIAIPVAVLTSVADTLLNHGRVRRGFIGIASQTVNLPENQRAGRNQATGLLVVSVEADSPAHHAGLLVGDILVGLDGHELGEPRDLQMLLASDRAGKTVALDVLRAGQLQNLDITIGAK
ncbi:S1C family serine protease [Herpetosiphon llansteffanensis]